METPSATEVLKSKLAAWSMGTAPVVAIQLDLLDAAEKAKSSDLGQLAKSILEKRPADNPVAQFADCLEGGDAIRGRAIFFGSAAASCRRCHKINGEGSDVGPDLSEIGKTKPRDYLLEAIVNPNAKIAEGFETAVFAMDDGQIYSGVVKKEDEQAFRIVTPKGELLTIEKAHVEGRAKGQSGMPSDISKQVPRREVRDLVEYLTTLVKKSDAGGHH
jgi:quinoprotein glucose dehydrogenase